MKKLPAKVVFATDPAHFTHPWRKVHTKSRRYQRRRRRKGTPLFFPLPFLLFLPDLLSVALKSPAVRFNWCLQFITPQTIDHFPATIYSNKPTVLQPKKGARAIAARKSSAVQHQKAAQVCILFLLMFMELYGVAVPHILSLISCN